jgi:dienelactone hydrolase
MNYRAFYRALARTSLSLLLCGSAALAQPPDFREIDRHLVLDGAPRAQVGPYFTMQDAAFDAPRYIVYRPVDLSAFPAQDTLPVVVWGNGGCSIENRLYDSFLGGIASHGFIVLATRRVEGDPQRMQANADHLLGAVGWAEAENARAGSPLQGKIDTEHVFVAGTSCGGFLAVSAGADPRVDSIGVFNSGLSAPPEGAPSDPARNPSALANLHGPALYINGGEIDFMYGASRANFDMLTVPAFYGAREGAGHSATMYHANGGEFGQVAAEWLKWQFKGDMEAGKTFVGDDCRLCVLDTWETASKGF